MKYNISNPRPLPPVEWLVEHFFINEKGEVCWLKPRTNSVKPGQVAGAIDSSGYRQIRIDDVVYQANRIAYKLANGVDPVGVVKHLDDNKLNNFPTNLEDDTNRQNSIDYHVQQTGRPPGCYWQEKTGKWQAQIRHNGKQVNLGRHKDQDLALGAYYLARCYIDAGMDVWDNRGKIKSVFK